MIEGDRMSKTLEELGYEKIQDDSVVLTYEKRIPDGFYDYTITFYKVTKKVMKTRGYSDACCFTLEELKAIYKWCEEHNWI